MATIINNPEPRGDRVIEVERISDGGAGWAIAIIILIAVIIGLFVWFRYYRGTVVVPATQPAQGGAANINVTVPPPANNTGGNTTGGSSGNTGTGGTGY